MSETTIRRFEYQDGKSAKFWEVTTKGATVTVRYGKIGTNGQSQTKELSDTAAVAKHIDNLISGKIGKGYVESSIAISDEEIPNFHESSSSFMRQESIIEPTKRMRDDIEKMSNIRNELIDFFNSIHDEYLDSKSNILACLKFSEPSFHLLGKEVAVERLDRTQSLVGRHLYISDIYPHPLSKGGSPIWDAKGKVKDKTLAGVKMFPVLQLNMDWINRVTGRNFTPSLVQLWLDPYYFYDALIRIIPLEDLSKERILKIDLDPKVYEEGCRYFADNMVGERNIMLSESELQWKGVPDISSQASFQLFECKPVGFSGPEIDDYVLENLIEKSDRVPRNVLKKLKYFNDLNSRSSKIKLKPNFVLIIFGEFIKSSNDDVGNFKGDGCLFSFDGGFYRSHVVTYVENEGKAGSTSYLYNH
jgi:predicted DNA-binding WGR domain protein